MERVRVTVHEKRVSSYGLDGVVLHVEAWEFLGGSSLRHRIAVSSYEVRTSRCCMVILQNRLEWKERRAETLKWP